MMRKGGCACGAARYEWSGKPLIVHACHCTDCQRLSGSAFGLNAWVKQSEVTLSSGSLRRVVVKGGSGKDHIIHACEVCGTQLWGQYTTAPSGSLFLRIGTLDAGHGLRPDAHIFTRSKQSWLDLPPGVPAFPEFYNPKKVWSAESFAWLAAQSKE